MSIEDVAQRFELAEWERINSRRESEPFKFAPGDSRYGPAECDECGEGMPALRREYGFRLCVLCKQYSERRSLR